MTPRGAHSDRLREKIPFERARGRRVTRPKVLILCEGKETEPNYLEALRNEARLSRDQLEILGLGYAPFSLVQAAVAKMAEVPADEADYQKVWCVFDHDQHPKLERAMELAEQEGISIAFSNPSFELWYLLHFQDKRGHIDRRGVIKELKKQGGFHRYQKSSAVYKDLKPTQGEAIRRAKALRKMHTGNGNPATDNPSTSVDQLVEYLNGLIGHLA
jgi:hypothetical protein